MASKGIRSITRGGQIGPTVVDGTACNVKGIPWSHCKLEDPLYVCFMFIFIRSYSFVIFVWLVFGRCSIMWGYYIPLSFSVKFTRYRQRYSVKLNVM